MADPICPALTCRAALAACIAAAGAVGCGPADVVCNGDIEARRSRVVESVPLVGSFSLRPGVPETLGLRAAMTEMPAELRVIESVMTPTLRFSATFSYPPGSAPPGQTELPVIAIELLTSYPFPKRESSRGADSFQTTETGGYCGLGEDSCGVSLEMSFLQDDPLYPAVDVGWLARGSITVAPCLEPQTVPPFEIERTLVP